MKVYITPCDSVETPESLPFEYLCKEEFIKAGHVLVDVPADADVVIVQATAHVVGWHNHSLRGSNVIMLSWEPPVVYPVISVYEHPEEFHSVFRFGPCDAGKNEFPITTDPIAYPYPAYGSGEDVIRESTTLRGRSVFFAGITRSFRGCESFGRTDLYPVRSCLIRDLSPWDITLHTEGPNFGRDSRKNGLVPRWDRVKLDRCRESLADFHLCCENSRLDNYVSEKIHHGFQSDLVVLYLGNPDIHKYVPPEAFINLNEYYDEKRGRVSAAVVAGVIKSMTQREYDDIIHAAREWRRTARLQERFDEQALRLTQRIIERIEEVK